MRGVSFPEPLPQPGQVVAWRHPRLAFALGQFNAYGPGPFEVVCVVDQSQRGLPAAVVVKTLLGEREVNEVWLARADEGRRKPAGDWQGYRAEVLDALDL